MKDVEQQEVLLDETTSTERSSVDQDIGRINMDDPITGKSMMAFIQFALTVSKVRNYRQQFCTTCPSCKDLIKTEIKRDKNSRPRKIGSYEISFLLIFLGMMLSVYAIVYQVYLLKCNEFLSDDEVEKLQLLIFMFLMLLVIFCVQACMIYTPDRFDDIKHFCPKCKQELWVSHGLKEGVNLV